MKTILQQLYDGEVHPCAQFSPETEAYQAMVRKHQIHYQEFIEKLKKAAPDLIDPFIQLMDQDLEFLSPQMEAMFADSFRLGAKMIMEIYQEPASEM